MRSYLWFMLVVVIVGHLALVLTNLCALMVLPFIAPWYEAAPLCTFLVLVSFTRNYECPLTRAENALRRRLGLKEIKGFVGVYLVRPGRYLLGRRRRPSPLCNDHTHGSRRNTRVGLPGPGLPVDPDGCS